MRNHFDEQLALLNKKLIEMGAMCEEVIETVARALIEGKPQLASEVIINGKEIDSMEREIEAICLKLLLQQQPVARDLRQVSAALKMITDMERIGDQAEDIAEMVIFLKGKTADATKDIKLMAEATTKMVTGSIDAYVRQDMELAKAVINEDDVVDDFFNRIKEYLIRTISENYADGELAVDLLLIAKYFERIGDHATNIAEWVMFSITGNHKGGTGK